MMIIGNRHGIEGIIYITRNLISVRKDIFYVLECDL